MIYWKYPLLKPFPCHLLTCQLTCHLSWLLSFHLVASLWVCHQTSSSVSILWGHLMPTTGSRPLLVFYQARVLLPWNHFCLSLRFTMMTLAGRNNVSGPLLPSFCIWFFWTRAFSSSFRLIAFDIWSMIDKQQSQVLWDEQLGAR